jgi:hypothetical protein
MCDLHLPPGHEKPAQNPGSPSANLRLPLFPSDLELSILKSKIYLQLYSPSALQQDHVETMKRIRELDEDLETWRYSLPTSVRPSLSFSQDHLPIYIHDIRAVVLRLEYHQCIAIIHLAISRCITSSPQLASIVKGIHSSLALSIEASRSTLKYLLAANPTINDHIFWYVCSNFPMNR